MLLSQKEGAEGKKYLAQRGLSEDTIQTHRLGFATAAWDSLAVFLQKQGVPANLAETLGLILPRKENSVAGGRPSYYDRFRHRIMFPIMSEGGRVCGFGGRLIGEAASANGIGSPKYMNSPESPIYSKGHNLYGLHIAKAPIREKGLALIVEGYMDLLSLHQEGFGNTVASLGTSLTPAQVGLLGRYTREAVLIFDGDESGQKATQRSVELFLKGNIAAQVALLPAGYDPDTFIRKEKRDGFERLLAKALPAVEYLLEQARRRYAIGTIEGKVRAVRELVTVLNALQDPLEKNLYVERVASQLGLKEPQVRAQLAGKVEAASELGPVQRKEEFRGSALERMLLQLMLRHNPFIPVVMEGIAPEGFIDPRHQKLAGKLNTLWETRKKVDVQELLERGEDADLKEMISELILTEESIVDADRMLKDCLRKVKLTRVHQEIQRVDEEIRQRSRQEVAAGGAGLKELLKRKQRLIAEQKKWIQDSAAGVTPLAGQ
jgi:DNA primase